MTATRIGPTLRDVVAVHEAASALGRPSTVYRTGGLMTAQQWGGHARTTRRSGYAWRLHRQCADLAALAALYGLAGQIIEAVEVSGR